MIKTMGSFVTYVPQDDRRSVILSEAKDLMDDYHKIELDFGGKTW